VADVFEGFGAVLAGYVEHDFDATTILVLLTMYVTQDLERGVVFWVIGEPSLIRGLGSVFMMKSSSPDETRITGRLVCRWNN
jgi:hypothetical protein